MLKRLRQLTIGSLQRCVISSGRRNPVKKRILSSEGQVAMVMILMAALGLVFYAVALNYNRVWETKNTTMIAAEQSASAMASFMASYAQQISEEQIKGGTKYCDKTSVFKAIARTFALIVLAVICTIFGQPEVAVLVWAAAAMAAGGAAIDALVIQPSITDMWNKAMKNLSTEGHVIELGIQWGLRMSVDDIVSFPDILDYDLDGVFGWKDPKKPWLLAKDGISRFSFYYTERLRQIRTPNPSEMGEFLRQLRDFVFFREYELDASGNPVAVSDLWGLHDPVDDTAHPCLDSDQTNNPPECDQGCIPTRPDACAIEECSWQLDDLTGEPALDIDGQLIPEKCIENWTTANTGASPACCYSSSRPPVQLDGNNDFVSVDGNYVFVSRDPRCDYYDVPAGNCSRGYLSSLDYKDVFDLFYEDTTNDVYSLRENIGRDDESPFYSVNPYAPDWHADAGHVQLLRDPAPADITITHDAYRVEDTSGFWNGDSQVVDGENPGIYPFLYAIQDIGVSLSKVNNEGYSDYHCYWKNNACADMYPYDNILVGNIDPDTYHHIDKIPTLLPMTGLINWTDYPYNLAGDETVVNLNEGGTPDIVPDPAALFLADGQCAHILLTIKNTSILNGEFEVARGWKRGIDRFCSTTYPYNTGCTKHSVCVDTATGEDGDVTEEERDCFCGEDASVSKELFPEDFLDDLYYGIPEFLDWAVTFLSSAEGQAGHMHKTIAEWYDDEIAKWIEPPCILPEGETCVPFCGDPACKLCGGTKDKKDKATCDPSQPEVIMHACCPGSVSKSGTPGILYQWRDDLKWLHDQLYSWMYTSYQGAGDCTGTNAVWCVPRATAATVFNEYGINECPGVTHNIPATATTAEIKREVSTFDVNGNGVRGDLEDVVACLDWNVKKLPNFKSCLDSCGRCTDNDPDTLCDSADTCETLPRSLVEQAGIYVNMTPYKDDYQSLFQDCYKAISDNVSTCNDACSLVPTKVYTDIPFYESWFCDYKFGPVNVWANTARADDFFKKVDEYKDIAFTGSCKNSTFTEWLDKSAQAAENLKIKLNQRYQYLEYLSREGQRILGILGEAIDRFDEFLNNNTPYAYDVGPQSDAGRTVLGTDAGAADYINPVRTRVVRWNQGAVWDDHGNKVSDHGNFYDSNGVDSPAELLIALRSKDNPVNKGDTSSVAVYVWQDGDIEIDGTPQPGPVHAVKVEVRAPKRCNSACDEDGTGPQQRWPWLETKTKRWGTERCYYLRDYVGRVKARVIRYDEPITNKAQRMFRFANNVPIWGMRTEHPDSVGPSGPGTIFNDGSSCSFLIDPIIRGIGEHVAKSIKGAPKRLHHAFMMNDIPVFSGEDCSSPEEGERYACCWTDVHKNMLRFGTHSESCAQYRWESADMGVRFVPCDEEFIAGQN